MHSNPAKKVNFHPPHTPPNNESAKTASKKKGKSVLYNIPPPSSKFPCQAGLAAFNLLTTAWWLSLKSTLDLYYWLLLFSFLAAATAFFFFLLLLYLFFAFANLPRHRLVIPKTEPSRTHLVCPYLKQILGLWFQKKKSYTIYCQ